MKIPTDRKYSETHEWYLGGEGGLLTIGITQHAADELTDITYVELPEVGTKVAAGDSIGEVESVKATAEIYSAVAGEIVEVNSALTEHPELINEDAYEEGWIARVRPMSADPLHALLDAKEYRSFIRNAG